MTAAIALRYWREGVIAALVLALVVMFALLDNRGNELDAARAQLAAEEARHSVTRGSVGALTSSLSEQSAKVRELSEASAARQKAAQDALAKAREREKATAAVVERLRASAAQRGPAPACDVSEALREAEGL